MNYSKSISSRVSVGTPTGGSVVSFQAQSDTLIYEPYFGLSEKPFSLIADPRFVYDSPTYVAARESLLAGIRRREGLLVLTGEIGTGKTTLCRAVVRDLGRKTYSSVVPDPFASREDLLKMLLIDFGVVSIQEITSGPLRGASRTELGYLLSQFLESVAADAFVVVIIDEAQNLSLPLIEETRILSDTFGALGRLQIVFAGQPELHAKLKLPEMRQVDQRVCGYHRMAPMSRDAVAGYIQHRLQVAGGQRDRILFPPAIVDALHQRSGGVPRLINRVCDRALQIAYERKTGSVDQAILDSALSEVGSTTLSPTWDSIVFAEPAPAPKAAPAPPTVRTAPPIQDDEDFKSQVDQWVSQDLAPASRTLTPLPITFDDDAPAPARRPAPKAVPKSTPKSAALPRTAKAEWRNEHSEIYMHRLWRRWAKRAAIAVAAFVALNLAVIGGALLFEGLSAPALPALPKAPALAVAGVALPEAPATDVPAPVAAAPTAAPATAAPVLVPDSGEYLVAVGLFAERGRADQLVEALTKAGLPAMQRPFQLRRQQVQQIVLGPFFSRSDAAADLRRLQQLGGYGDASVVVNAHDTRVASSQ